MNARPTSIPFRSALGALLALTLQFAVAAPAQKPVQKPGEKVLAVVNGHPITQAMVDVFAAKMRGVHHRKGNLEVQALDQLIKILLITDDAERKGLDKDPSVQRQLAWYRRSVLFNAGLRDYLRRHPITDKEIEQRYREKVAKFDGTEYKARHILVKTEDEARKLIDQLKKGADFAELAKQHSTGPTGKNGGELGWFSAGQMVAPFAEAVKKMKKGEISATPVKTPFGWHVIQLEDTRKVDPPGLDKLRRKITAELQNERIEAYLTELGKHAKIEIKDPRFTKQK